jgi:Hemerythrin HHE cation binding domain
MPNDRSRSSPGSSRNRRPTPDPFKILKEDHARVQSLFNKYEKMESDAEKQELATTICQELKLHAALEEEVFYPPVRRAIEDKEIMNEADVEHAGAKELIAKIEKSRPKDEHFDALVTVLGEAIKHHVKEEEGEMFKQVRKSDLDLDALGEKMMKFKSDHEA